MPRCLKNSVQRAAELDERSQRLALLNKFSSDLSGELNADQVLRLTAKQLRQALEATRVAVVEVGPGDNATLKTVLPEELTSQSVGSLLPASPVFGRLKESLGIFTSDEITTEPELLPLSEILEGTRSLYDPADCAAVRIYMLYSSKNDQDSSFLTYRN